MCVTGMLNVAISFGNGGQIPPALLGSQHPQTPAALGFSSPHVDRVTACLCPPSCGADKHVSNAERLRAASLQESW